MSGAERRPLRIVWDLLLRRERWSILGLLVLTLVGVVLETLSLGAVIPVITVLVQDPSSLSELNIPFVNNSMSRLSLIVVSMSALTGLMLLKHCFTLWSSWLQFGVYAELNVRLSQQLFGNYLNRPYQFHTQHSTAELITNTQNANLIITGAVTPLLTLTGESLVGLGLFSILVIVEPAATLGALAVFLVFGISFQRITRSRIDTWGRAGIRHRRDAMRHLQEGFGGIKDLKVLGRESSYLLKHESNLRQLATANRKFSTLQGVPRVILETVALSGLSLLVVVLTIQGRSGAEVLPVLGLFAAGAFRVAPSVNRVLVSIQQIRFALPMIRTLEPDLAPHDAQNQSRGVQSQLQFENLTVNSVHFSHFQRASETLRGLNLQLRKGSSIGIMGESGVGKSTLIDVILGLLHPDSGSVLVNSTDLSECGGEWRRIVGYVPQTIFLADATIRSNVAFGLADSEIDDSLVDRAIDLAQLRSFVQSLEHGIQTVVGERGVRLSGGQRQRIGIARALYGRPQVLIFDEATSSLDSETEQAFLDSIRDLRDHYTMLVVAHRTSTLKYCSGVFQLRDGVLHEIEVA